MATGDIRQSSPIIDFYADQTIFITGVTGFLGKILLAKILRHCPNVRKIYCLVRGRQGLSAFARLQNEVLNLAFFKEIFDQMPDLKDKIVVVEGDIALDKLGLSQEASAVIEQDTTIILHCAASTRFQETLKVAVQLNTLGALQVLHLAHKCKHLIAHVHVSTAYVHCIHNGGNVEIREKVYPMPINPFEFVERLSAISAEEAHQKTAKLIAPYPNTYTLSKALGEHFLLSEKGDIPLCIVRPSIVGCAYQYPTPGWLDSLLGANGLFVMLAVGMLHCMHGAEGFVCDFIPVDIVASIIIAAAWRTAKVYKTTIQGSVNPKHSVPIYHATTSTRNPVFWSWPGRIVEGYFRRHQIKKSVGYPWCFFIRSKMVFNMAHTLFHVLPAALADGQLWLKGRPIKSMKVASRLKKSVESLAYFTNHQWFYANDNVDALIEDMSEYDTEIFPMDVRKIDWEEYFVRYSHGLRRFLFKEGDVLQDEQVTHPMRSKL